MQHTKELNSLIVASCNRLVVDDFKSDIYIEGRLSQTYLAQNSRLVLLSSSKTKIRVFMSRYQLSKKAEPTVPQLASLIDDLGWNKASIAVMEQLVPKLLSWIEREAARIGIFEINVRKLNNTRLEIGDSIWPTYTLCWLRPDWNGDISLPIQSTGHVRPILRRSSRLGPTSLARLTVQAISEGTYGSTKAEVDVPEIVVETNLLPPAAIPVPRAAGITRAARAFRSDTTRLGPKSQEIIHRVLQDEQLRCSDYMRDVGSPAVEETLVRVLTEVPSVQLYQQLAVEVQEILLEKILEVDLEANDEFELHFRNV